MSANDRKGIGCIVVGSFAGAAALVANQPGNPENMAEIVILGIISVALIAAGYVFLKD